MCDSDSRVNESRDGGAEDQISIENHVEDGKNKHLVKCQFCTSKILNPGSGQYKNVEFDLPKFTKTKLQTEDTSRDVDYEQMTHFWQVPDMYSFENIGFSHNVGNIKYLACADCEAGPIGYYDVISKISYVALARVQHIS